MAGPKNRKTEIEQEVKITLSSQDLEKVFRSFSRKEGATAVEHKYLPRAYYDTPALELHKQGISLRVQYKKGAKGKLGGHEQTVKFDLLPEGGAVSGVLLRKECKDMLKSHAPDLSAVSDRKAKKLLAPFRGKKLTHLFTAAIERRYFNLSVGKGKKKGTVELAFDVGEVVLADGSKRESFTEIEIELKDGNPAAIMDVEEKVLRLARSAHIQPLSKADQGVQLYLSAQR